MAARTKVLYLLRHGQAVHNVRAEPLREAGCSMEEFIAQMKADDALDADLTDTGRSQAVAAGAKHQGTGIKEIELVVATTLSRAIETADLVLPAANVAAGAPRVLLEDFREISGLLLNAKRRPTADIRTRWGPAGWDLSQVTEADDTLWTSEALESWDNVATRAQAGLRWVWGRPEEVVAVVAHGGIFGHMVTRSPGVVCSPAQGRFGNCELRRYTMTADGDKFVLEQSD